jgi:endonuclease-3
MDKIMTKKAILIKEYLDEILPDARCALNYTKDYELVIAVMLSAQTTDKAVNQVTKDLFLKYTTVEEFANANLFDIEQSIQKIGMYKVKAKNIIGIAKALVEKHNSIVPQEKELLTELPGVGVKTANVVRAELFNIPEIAVDTHILRISKRLKLANENDGPLEVESSLRKKFNVNQYIKLHHQLIWFGRTVCKAKNPSCDVCKLKDVCKYYKEQ